MSNLYIFAIGGTGARVLRSFSILLASGLKINADKIIPIIIDTDSQNEDTNRTIKLLNNYRDIRRKIPNLKNSFFHNPILSLHDLGSVENDNSIPDSFHLKLPETSGQTFREYINFNFIQDPETKAFLQLLYSKDNFDDSLTYGFLGSPNVGTVVLNSINKTEFFKNFFNLFQNDDRIFIISSIFGGTGAAGFPLLLNNFINSNYNALDNSIKGAVSVLPYFALDKNDNSRIDSSSFITKSIAALSYYSDNLKNLNLLYYIGHSPFSKSYTNFEGGQHQKNDANFIELAAALSIYDFMSMPDDALKKTSKFKEFAIDIDVNQSDSKLPDQLNFYHLGAKTKSLIFKNLTALHFFNLFYKELSKFIESSFMIDNNINESFFFGDFFKSLDDFFITHYKNWLVELSRNSLGFKPFLSNSISDLSNLINGYQPSKNIFGKPKLNKSHFIIECSKVKPNFAFSEENFLNMIFMASSNIINKNLSPLI